MNEFTKGNDAVDPFTIFESEGVPVNADSLPIINSIRVGDSYPTVAGANISQVLDGNGSPRVGVYELTVPTDSFDVDDVVDVTYSATVAGNPVGPISFLFRVDEDISASLDGALVSASHVPSIVFDNDVDQGGGGGAVDSVNGQTGDVTIGASDVGAATVAQGATADTAMQPGGNVSELVNDAGYLASVPVDSVNGQTGNVTLGASDVGLGNVNNTADVDKPVSTAVQSELDAKADLIGGVVPTSQIPSIALVEFLGDVASEAAMLALSGQPGDWCLRTDLGVGYVIVGADPSQLSDWKNVTVPTSSVTSVNGQTGTVVLGASDVGAATAAQGSTADTALQPGDVGSSVQPFDANTVIDADYVATDENFTTGLKSKLDSVESGADVTDSANVQAAGALMDSELTDVAAVKAIDQGLATGDDVEFGDIQSGNIEILGGTSDQTLNIVVGQNLSDAGGSINFYAAGRNDVGEAMAQVKAHLLNNNGGSGNVQRGDLSVSTFGIERIRIKESGNVGIGTDSPSEKLEVDGNFNVLGNSTENKTIKIGHGRSGDGFSKIQLVGDTVYSTFGTLFQRNPGENGNSVITHRGTGDLRLVSQDAGKIQFRTSNAPRMTIDESGNIGVNTTLPSEELEVNGNAKVSGFVDVGQFIDLTPSSTPFGVAGRVYYDSTTNKLRCHDGTTWNDLF